MADDLKEIVTVEQIDRLFLLLAVGGPILGGLIGGLSGKKSGNAAKSVKMGIIIGMAGPANLVLWKVYNAITGKLGLDTVKNLLVNLALFIAIGIIAGWTISYVNKKNNSNLNSPKHESSDHEIQSGASNGA